jgi:hypothetical protein
MLRIRGWDYVSWTVCWKCSVRHRVQEDSSVQSPSRHIPGINGGRSQGNLRLIRNSQIPKFGQNPVGEQLYFWRFLTKVEEVTAILLSFLA